MNAPLPVEQARSPFGGSRAERILQCRASVKLIEQVPDYLQRSTIYNERGSALHEVTALLLADIGLPLRAYRQDVRHLCDHDRRCRKRTTAGSRLCEPAP
jgi:hypothetical protein